MRHSFLTTIATCSIFLTPLASGTERVISSAHGEALYLVLTDQAAELRRLDPDTDSQEASARTWLVTRPAGSGILDRANTFTVTFSIDGRAVASWYVNTGEGTVEPQRLPTPPALP